MPMLLIVSRPQTLNWTCGGSSFLLNLKVIMKNWVNTSITRSCSDQPSWLEQRHYDILAIYLSDFSINAGEDHRAICFKKKMDILMDSELVVQSADCTFLVDIIPFSE